MSTYYATVQNIRDALELLHELLRAGVAPDDVSLVSKETLPGSEDFPSTIGDATAFVGREDDPPTDRLVPEDMGAADRIAETASPIAGIDTSNSATNVDSVDQSDDSQSYAEDSIQPPGEISHAEHERDDLELAVRTGFPTAVPLLDDVVDSETPVQDQYDDGLETISMPGAGTVAGGGAMATAALDFFQPDRTDHGEALLRHLQDEGMDEERARIYVHALNNRRTLLAVHANPGTVDDEVLESYLSRHQLQNLEMVDAPRFFEGGGKARMI
ncbi:MAG TPA: hypothetical protein VGE01_06370 [Fimbriimonas sp.]